LATEKAKVRIVEIQRSAGSGDFIPESKRKVIVGGEVFLYGQKAPFVSSGASVLGAARAIYQKPIRNFAEGRSGPGGAVAG
jgi:hypothetical protein